MGKVETLDPGLSRLELLESPAIQSSARSIGISGILQGEDVRNQKTWAYSPACWDFSPHRVSSRSIGPVVAKEVASVEELSPFNMGDR